MSRCRRVTGRQRARNAQRVYFSDEPEGFRRGRAHGRASAHRRGARRSRERATCSPSKRRRSPTSRRGSATHSCARCELILDCRGRVVVCGIGKSGHVGRKFAATLASTGTPAFFVHASDAMHGDLGMIAAEDVLVMLSNSGETDEVISAHSARQARGGADHRDDRQRRQSRLATPRRITSTSESTRKPARSGLAPTASTTATLALATHWPWLCSMRGDSRRDDFLRSHPVGSARPPLLHVRDVMRSGDALAGHATGATLAEAIDEMSRKGMGMTVVVRRRPAASRASSPTATCAAA